MRSMNPSRVTPMVSRALDWYPGIVIMRRNFSVMLAIVRFAGRDRHAVRVVDILSLPCTESSYRFRRSLPALLWPYWAFCAFRVSSWLYSFDQAAWVSVLRQVLAAAAQHGLQYVGRHVPARSFLPAKSAIGFVVRHFVQKRYAMTTMTLAALASLCSKFSACVCVCMCVCLASVCSKMRRRTGDRVVLRLRTHKQAAREQQLASIRGFSARQRT